MGEKPKTWLGTFDVTAGAARTIPVAMPNKAIAEEAS